MNQVAVTRADDPGRVRVVLATHNQHKLEEFAAIIAQRIASKTIDEWLAILEPADIWCAKVLTWPEMLASEGFQSLDMLQTVTRDDDVSILTTSSPLRVDGVRAKVDRAAPRIGEHSAAIREEFGL